MPLVTVVESAGSGTRQGSDACAFSAARERADRSSSHCADSYSFSRSHVFAMTTGLRGCTIIHLGRTRDGDAQ